MDLPSIFSILLLAVAISLALTKLNRQKLPFISRKPNWGDAVLFAFILPVSAMIFMVATNAYASLGLAPSSMQIIGATLFLALALIGGLMLGALKECLKKGAA